MPQTTMLEQIFGSRTRVKLLRLLLLNPEQNYFVRELTRLLGEQINSVRRELENLAAIDLLIFEEKNQKKYFRANPNCLYFDELQALFLKSHLALEKDLVHGLKQMESMKYLLLAGVFTDDAKARTDILCVGNIDKKHFRMLVKRFRKDFPRDLNYTIFTEEEFQYRKDISDKFLYDILDSDHIVVINKLDGVA